MSIWASQDIAGTDDNDNHDGSVVSYISGWSNHYPGRFIGPNVEPHYGFMKDIQAETPASIGTGWIPPWCVPGQDEQDETYGLDIDTHVGPWLRLDLTMRTVSIWSGVEGNWDVYSVCMNESAVRALRDHLTEWLERDKVHPTQPKESSEVSGEEN
ncbi:hypothetical protein PBI_MICHELLEMYBELL_52 [Mycobacterium phage MichelleMyBell]|uniref:Uncharacterized protein n=1 Tax=Mycobacterium phage MichelleMyBell TaxID=1445726 RepID=W0LNT3_9CAUD|nr:hypothetical protein CH20_gp52 [Mycobacterium phage MichelleMyBell]AHG24373.1 hypothetical protein PBI_MICHELLEMYBELL_52 [Mycobacterium phage MichelleMyBell]